MPQVGEESRPLGVVAHQAGDLHGAPERRDVVRHVRRAAEGVALVIELHHRDRRFGRNPLHASDDEMIEHQIPDDEYDPAGEA